MIEPIDIKLAVYPKQIHPPKQKNSIQMPSKKIFQSFEKIRAIRLNLEKVLK